jgi:hypothetical protein
LQDFFDRKNEEVKGRQRFTKTEFFKPNRVHISAALRRQLCDLATQNKTRFGLITAGLGENSFELDEYFDVGCRSGPILHLYPDFRKLHKTKRYLEMIGKAISHSRKR